MRSKINGQSELDFHRSNLQVTNEYYEKYENVSAVLDENPKVLHLVHEDLKDELESTKSPDGRIGRGRCVRERLPWHRIDK